MQYTKMSANTRELDIVIVVVIDIVEGLVIQNQ